jgi:hypothetical protein
VRFGIQLPGNVTSLEQLKLALALRFGVDVSKIRLTPQARARRRGLLQDVLDGLWLVEIDFSSAETAVAAQDTLLNNFQSVNTVLVENGLPAATLTTPPTIVVGGGSVVATTTAAGGGDSGAEGGLPPLAIVGIVIGVVVGVVCVVLLAYYAVRRGGEAPEETEAAVDGLQVPYSWRREAPVPVSVSAANGIQVPYSWRPQQA